MQARTLLFGIFPALAMLFHPAATSAKQIQYRGYVIETGHQDGGADLDAMLPRLKGQIDIIEQVGLTASVSAFFR